VPTFHRQTWEPTICSCAIQYSFTDQDLSTVHDFYFHRICDRHARLLPFSLDVLQRRSTSSIWRDAPFRAAYFQILKEQQDHDSTAAPAAEA